MNIYRLFLFLSISLIILSCNKKSPNDFSFVLQDEVDKIDSKNHSLTRLYIPKDSTVNIYFTQRDLDKIYTSFIKNGLDTFPVNYEPKCQIRIIPTFFDRITIRYNGKEFKLLYNWDYQCKSKDDIRRLEHIKHFVDYLWKIIKDKKEYKNLKETNMIFM